MDDAVKLLLESLRIYSPSTREGRISKLLQARMRSLGFANVRTDAAQNAIGEMGSGHPHLLLCGHMDTVPGALKVRVDGERIYGRGAADAKGPLCAEILAAASARPRGMKVTMACVSREEGDSLGIKTLIEAGGDYDYAIFGEPAGAARITIGYRGRVAAHVSVKTQGGHASSSWAHASAVEGALAILARIKEYEAKHAVEGNHIKSLSASLTLIRGGSFSNVVPKSCTMTFDVRIPEGTKSEEVKRQLSELVAQQGNSSGNLVEIRFDQATEPYEAPLDSVVVRAVQRSILKNLGTRPVLTHKTGTGDMNTLAERMGIPCVTYGPGDSSLGHTEAESIEIPDYLNSIKVLQGAIHEVGALRGTR
jgi:[amino group carrier protein]-lysine/ornithine hydrolase